MRHAVGELVAQWRTYGHDLGFGVWIAHGYATLGCIGFEGRFQYSATGTVANLASRTLLQGNRWPSILVDAKVCSEVNSLAELELVGELELKGFQCPVKAFNVLRLLVVAPAA